VVNSAVRLHCTRIQSVFEAALQSELVEFVHDVFAALPDIEVLAFAPVTPSSDICIVKDISITLFSFLKTTCLSNTGIYISNNDMLSGLVNLSAEQKILLLFRQTGTDNMVLSTQIT